MISHEKATLINAKIQSLESKLIYPPQNLVDLIWAEKPEKPHAMVYIQSTEFAGPPFPPEYLGYPLTSCSSLGRSAESKLEELREWIKLQPASIPSYSKQQEPLASQVHVATLVTSLSCIGMCYGRCNILLPCVAYNKFSQRMY